MSNNRFIITGTQRVGSSTIANALGHHSKIACGWQWPHLLSWPQRVKACRLALHGDFGSLAPKHQEHMKAEFCERSEWIGYRNLFRANEYWMGAPRFAASLILDRFYENMKWWTSDPELHIIHIIRTDNLAWLRSKFVARELGTFGAGSKYAENVSVEIPIHRAIKRLKMKRWLDDRLGELHRHNPYHVIRYEDLLTDRDSVIREVQAFLGLATELMPNEMIRQRQSKGIPIEQHIANYHDLRQALQDAKILTASMPTH